eukprot:16446645-Heterocapsa_arctica.AAC.1
MHGHRKADCYARVATICEEENDDCDVPVPTGEEEEFEELADDGVGVVLAVMPDEAHVVSTSAARPAQRPERGLPGVAPSKLTPPGRAKGPSAFCLGAPAGAAGSLTDDLTGPAPRRRR